MFNPTELQVVLGAAIAVGGTVLIVGLAVLAWARL